MISNDFELKEVLVCRGAGEFGTAAGRTSVGVRALSLLDLDWLINGCP